MQAVVGKYIVHWAVLRFETLNLHLKSLHRGR